MNEASSAVSIADREGYQSVGYDVSTLATTTSSSCSRLLEVEEEKYDVPRQIQRTRVAFVDVHLPEYSCLMAIMITRYYSHY